MKKFLIASLLAAAILAATVCAPATFAQSASTDETLSQQIGAVTAQSIAAHAKAEAAIYAALSPEQQTKAAQLPELLGEGGGPGWGHGGPR
jgi:hypothetical protein